MTAKDAAPISYPAGEQPKWQGLRSAIQAYYGALLPPLATLQVAVFASMPGFAPKKAEESVEPAFAYTSAQRRVIEQAVEIFLTEMAGPDRSFAGFVSEEGDGVLQERSLFTYQIGLQRGADMLQADQMMAAARESPAVRAMLEEAFNRLSEDGRLTLENIADDIHGVLVGAQEAGLNPLETARQLTRQFDEYEGWEFQRLARTESAYAAEAGSRDQMAELGVEEVEWLISAGACPICEAYAGQAFGIDDTSNHPPAHPNCLCSTVPVAQQEEG